MYAMYKAQDRYWFERAASQGSLEAMMRLGFPYIEPINLQQFLGEKDVITAQQAAYIYTFARHKLVSDERLAGQWLMPKLLDFASRFAVDAEGNFQPIVAKGGADDDMDGKGYKPAVYLREMEKTWSSMGGTPQALDRARELAIKFTHFVQKNINERALHNMKYFL